MLRIKSLDQLEYDESPPADVAVKRLKWDWNDTSLIPRQQYHKIHDSGLSGCWYINPCSLVYCESFAPNFLFKARKCQEQWFRILDRQFPRGGWRNLMEVTQSELERYAAFNGILIIDGHDCDSNNWNSIEELIGIRHRVTRRQTAFRMVSQQDWHGLIRLSQIELQGQIDSNPDMAIFVTPGVTVVGMPLRSFYREAARRRFEWHRHLQRVLGNRHVSAFARSADWPVRMLAINGTLVVNGQIFLSGQWPGRILTNRHWAIAPFGVPTVPPEYLGLTAPDDGSFVTLSQFMPNPTPESQDEL